MADTRDNQSRIIKYIYTTTKKVDMFCLLYIMYGYEFYFIFYLFGSVSQKKLFSLHNVALCVICKQPPWCY
jgi:hypothetical protein